MWEDDAAIVRHLRNKFDDENIRIYDVSQMDVGGANDSYLPDAGEATLVNSLIAQSGADLRPANAYSAVVLDGRSKEICRNMVQMSEGWQWTGHHMTVNLGRIDDTINPGLASRVGEPVELRCSQLGWSAQAAAIEVESATLVSDGQRIQSSRGQAVQHVTLCCSPDGSARDANKISSWQTMQTITLRGHVQEVLLLERPDAPSQALTHLLDNHGSSPDLAGRRRVFEAFQLLCERWRQAEHPEGWLKLLPVGSHAIGCDVTGDDIDVVGVGSIDATQMEVSSLASFLSASAGVSGARVVESGMGARRCLLNLRLQGVELDLVLVDVSDCTGLSEPADQRWLDSPQAHQIPQLSALRDVAAVRTLVHNVEAPFTCALRLIKLFARRRGISDNKLGFIGGVGWCVMLARIAADAPPQVEPLQLLRRFFEEYGTGERTAIGLAGAKPSPTALAHLRRSGLCVLTPSPSHADGTHDNIARNSTATTAAHVFAELRRAHELCAAHDDDAFFRRAGPTILAPVAKPDMQQAFSAVLRIRAEEPEHLQLLGSKLVQLALQLEDALAPTRWLPLRSKRCSWPGVASGAQTLRLALVRDGGSEAGEQLGAEVEAVARAWAGTGCEVRLVPL